MCVNFWASWVLLAGSLSGLCGAAPTKVEVKRGASGLYVAALSVGTPPQRIWMALDTGSSWSWIPEAESGESAGFHTSKSSSATLGDEKSLTFADGDTVSGHILKEHISIGGLEVSDATMVLAQNTTAPSGEGLLGLVDDNTKEPAAWLRGFFRKKNKDNTGRSIMTSLWDAHQEVPQTYRLELGLPSPQLLVGVPSSDSSLSGPSDITFLGPTLTRLVPNWYVSMRAIGLSYGKDNPSLRMSFDFNSEFAFGAAALLDSGATAIRVGSGIWERIMLGMPNGCRQGKQGEIGCPCKEELPTISMSLETMATFRILGLDSGADIIVCIPPSAYVTQSNKSKDWCELAIVNAGEHHTMWGLEAVVLGLPFFRSASVVFDAGNRVVGVEPVQRRDSSKAMCSDPKNWWSTGRRFSPKRVVVALMIVTMISSYVFVGFSQSRTAERLRALLESLLGPTSRHAFGTPWHQVYGRPLHHGNTAGEAYPKKVVPGVFNGVPGDVPYEKKLWYIRDTGDFAGSSSLRCRGRESGECSFKSTANSIGFPSPASPGVLSPSASAPNLARERPPSPSSGLGGREPRGIENSHALLHYGRQRVAPETLRTAGLSTFLMRRYQETTSALAYL